ncbi:Large subunit of-dimethylformamidase protein [Pleurostoma richardsiae]|uniref:Large subunit of-dimethylformamidase protein n=1 Tax=Pleurostoma richardsiae TaxID=41990 RepID=A0AA38RK93_9PEZI|nr:Large subunit of-dimethylformamidase protein [Pleurostoma richardsiae]
MNTGGLQFDQTEISTGSRLPDEYLNEDEIIGYVEPWVVSPDEDIAVKVSSTVPTFTWSLTLVSTLDVEAATGFALVIALSGDIDAYIGDGEVVRRYETRIQLRRWRWAELSLEITRVAVKMRVNHRTRLTEKAPQSEIFEIALSLGSVIGGNKPLTFAAGFFSDYGVASNVPTSSLNGRLDSPHLQISFDGERFETWAHYNFALDLSSDMILDISGSERHGVLVNAPTRGVKGHDWDGSEPDWTKAKYGYGAIHFHEDDLDDAAWATDFTVRIPEDAVSGAYAVVVRGVERDVVDDITFFVRPPEKRGMARARAAIVLSTFTYLAYANEHMYDEDRASHMELAGGVKIRKDHHWRRMARRADLGLALYDVHRDGSGTVFTSSKRPILNIRPGYVNWAFHRPREFSADQLMLGFLERTLGRGGYDVLTDHDLHIKGADSLMDYDVVVTGCHPEYPSLQTLNVYAAFARDGGHIMYLGGNGFYWTSVTDPSRPHRMEVRRGDQGCRSFGMPAGERVHSLSGEQGGLWRGRGRNPQTLFGIGSCACGSGPGVPYRALQAAATSPKFQWIWEGLRNSESEPLPLIGTDGFGGGASGDEIDRLDYELGSPENTVLLATSTGHDDSFGVFNEEIMFPMVDTLGTTCDKVRSDMTYYETNGGGAVFSVGSINWSSSGEAGEGRELVMRPSSLTSSTSH